MNLEQIALRMAEETNAAVGYVGETCLFAVWVSEFARRLVAELTKGQEPVAKVMDLFGRQTSCAITPALMVGTELFAASPICPAAEWQLVPKEPTPEMVNAAWENAAEEAGAGLELTGPIQVFRAMLAAAPEYKP